jgi:hypothetical protein
VKPHPNQKVSDAELLAAKHEGLSWSEIVERFKGKITKRRVGYRLKRLRTQWVKDPSRLLTSPIDPPPPGQLLKGTSTLVGPKGEMLVQWIKTDRDRENEKLAQEAALKALCEKLEPLEPREGPGLMDTRLELLNLYTLTDCHVGMLAWPRETGEPWDLKIAEQVLVDCFSRLVESTPVATTCIVNQLGDFLHFDSLKAVTPEHQNQLDSDSRYQRVVETAVRVLRRVIELALEKHEKVQVYMHEGNHDPAGSVWLRVMFAQLYANEPRVSVDTSPLPYVAYQHGKTMLAFHHGHLAAKESLPLLFAARFPEIWGTANARYVHVGHKHSIDVREYPGAVVEQHPTLASADAYAARGGWLSRRQASAITYHITRGEVGRVVVVPEGVDVFGR